MKKQQKNGKKNGNFYNINNNIYVGTNNLQELKKEAENLKDIYSRNDLQIAFGEISATMNSISTIYKIEEIVLNTFIIMIAMLCTLNIFSIIVSNIVLRKRELMMLKSIGMNQKQINKMLFLEGILYAWDSCIYSVLISLILSFIMYVKMVEINRYAFFIPWGQIGVCIVVTCVIIFLAIIIGKSRIKSKNIIETIKNENC